MSSLEYVKKVLADAERVVCLVGRGTTFQTGCQLYDGDFEYEIESRYGLSVEEIFSESYYNNRTREFFEFYREEVLKHCGEPNAVYQTLARMEQDGKLIGIISRSIFGLCERAGFKTLWISTEPFLKTAVRDAAENMITIIFWIISRFLTVKTAGRWCGLRSC